MTNFDPKKLNKKNNHCPNSINYAELVIDNNYLNVDDFLDNQFYYGVKQNHYLKSRGLTNCNKSPKGNADLYQFLLNVMTAVAQVGNFSID